MPVFFLLVMTLVLIIKYETTHNSKSEKQTSKDFWEREREASFTRNKDISGLDYIKIPDELIMALPLLDNAEYNEAKEKLISLKDTKILNLTGLSNTDLKANYGTGNFAFLSECDERFNDLYVAIKAIIKTLDKEGFADLSERFSSYLDSLTAHF